MASFKFKFATVLSHREHVEQEKQRLFLLARAGQAKVQEQIRALEESVRVSTQELREKHLVGNIDLAYLTAHRRFTLSMHREAAALLDLLKQHDVKVADARAELAEATQQRKMLEQLRDNRRTAWLEEQARRETADLDEVAMQMSFDQLVDNEAESNRAGEVPS